MRVLNVVHRVVVGAGLRQLEVEVQVLIVAAHDVEQARRIVSHLLAQLAQGDELSRARRHLHPLAAAEQGDELHQAHLEAFRRAAERGQAGAQAGDVAVVVRAPDIKQVLEAAPALVADESDVGGEVRLNAVFAHDHSILLIAVCGALEPQCAVLEVGMARRLQRGDRSIDLATVDQRAFREPGIVSHAELGQVFADIGEDAAESQIQHAAKCRIPEQQARTGNQRIDVDVLVAALRFVRRQILENLCGAVARARRPAPHAAHRQSP